MERFNLKFERYFSLKKKSVGYIIEFVNRALEFFFLLFCMRIREVKIIIIYLKEGIERRVIKIYIIVIFECFNFTVELYKSEEFLLSNDIYFYNYTDKVFFLVW